MERHVVFRSVLNQRNDVGRSTRTYYAQRPDFVDTGVAGVQLREEFVAVDFTIQNASQISLVNVPRSLRPDSVGLLG